MPELPPIPASAVPVSASPAPAHRTPAHEPPVHHQTIPGLGTITIRPLDPWADAEVVHGWVGEERASFWGMNGLTRDQVAEIYAHMATLDTHHAFVVVRDTDPVALLQTYEPEADRVSEVYDPLPGDIGVHLLLAPAGPGGGRPGWTAALLTVVASYVFGTLDRRRVVVDPDIRNEKAIARFLKQGFTAGPMVVLPEVDLPDVYIPEKKAQLAFLSRG
ncbi:GNAT family N-acetyltransferase [Streptomyces lanatus]|uniref:Lysine N-acyltransferase MbtK n=1 Tax=Streptomyces lanatus TaxID=66900 RepID=A0ABV1XQQ7_9ACTN|nr:GNAT family N-acetyltransferase [Streptomyces lanatus]GHH06233.1 acetyltransferase [Streptomyces lanatus]